MAEELPGLSDDTVELLRRLSAHANAQATSEAEVVSLADALRYPAPLPGIGDNAAAEPELRGAGACLSQLTAKEVVLLQEIAGPGSVATKDCRALNPALVKISYERELARKEAMRRRHLEWLQLASCLDHESLRVGAYPAHAQRFLFKAAERMAYHFPWVDFRLEVQHNRPRVDMFRGSIQDGFDAGNFDYMMIPRERGPVRISSVYTYTFRVMGSPSKLHELRDSNGLVHVSRLRGERLILSGAGTSSRRRLTELFAKEGMDINAGPAPLEELDPDSMRARAESGEGIAVLSDEYTAVGGAAPGFPRLAFGPDRARPVIYRVEMGLLGQRNARMPRHRAFEFIVHELMAEEKERDRAAAQS